VVLVRYESVVERTHKLAVVIEANPGSDGLVRTVRLAYAHRRDDGSYVRHETNRSVHAIVLISPIEERGPEPGVV